MKVLTIKEPFATLIKDGIKIYETRSWKTNYRGEIYIHAGKSFSKSANVTIASNYLKSKPNPSHILCKCILKDCILMTPQFIKEVQKNQQEFNSGRYEVGRYAWQLEVVEILEEPIYAKGKLGIWTYEKHE